LTESISLDGLMNAAKLKSGSRDVGAWLFTALLRSVGVQTRLVCSLQPLQYGFLNEGPRQAFYSIETPQQQAPTTAMSRDQSHISISSKDTPPPPRSTIRNPSFPSSSRDVGTYTTPAEYIADRKTYSPYNPFFWSEAWDVASQKWIAVEPMVAARVNQPSKIEPPVNAATWEAGAIGDNILSYAVGFDNSLFPLECS
jgi:xeroderma pigmentosum group C-complementing protein